MGLISLMAAVALLLVVLLATTKWWEGQGIVEEPQLEGRILQCPREFAAQVFSRQDWEYVRGIQEAGIAQLFRHERKRVALLWVRQISALMRQVMREHAEAARESRDLKFGTEAKIFLSYAGLRMICGWMFISIRVAGPVWLGGMADYAQRLSERLAGTQQEFQASRMNAARTL
jgi:hypothetical protein